MSDENQSSFGLPDFLKKLWKRNPRVGDAAPKLADTQPYDQSPSMNTDQWIKDHFFDGNEIKEEYRLGIALWEEIINIDPNFSGDRKMLVITTMLVSPPFDSPMLLSQMLVNWNRSSMLPQDEKGARTRSAYNFMRELKPLQDKARARVQASHHQFGAMKSDILAPLVNEIDEYDYECDEHKVGNDIFVYHLPKKISPDLQTQLNRAIQKIESTWTRLRRGTDQQVVTVFLSPHNNRIVRSYTYMNTNPKMLLAFNENDEDLDQLVIHEVIHMAFGVESGNPQSLDFAEGCATRLAIELGANREAVYRSMSHLIPLIHELSSQTNRLSSSSEGIGRMKQLNKHWDEVKMAEAQLTYIWGYFLVDGLLSNRRYQATNAAWIQSGRGEFDYLFFINKCYTEEYAKIKQSGTDVSQRLLLRRVIIQRLGFTFDEFKELLSEISEKIAQAARDTNHLTKPN